MSHDDGVSVTDDLSYELRDAGTQCRDICESVDLSKRVVRFLVLIIIFVLSMKFFLLQLHSHKSFNLLFVLLSNNASIKCFAALWYYDYARLAATVPKGKKV
jgi:phosphoglycerol transferase MdoB-like AlkP superfamily enzyme